jgi:hypothetical protein
LRSVKNCLDVVPFGFLGGICFSLVILLVIVVFPDYMQGQIDGLCHCQLLSRYLFSFLFLNDTSFNVIFMRHFLHKCPPTFSILFDKSLFVNPAELSFWNKRACGKEVLKLRTTSRHQVLTIAIDFFEMLIFSFMTQKAESKLNNKKINITSKISGQWSVRGFPLQQILQICENYGTFLR